MTEISVAEAQTRLTGLIHRVEGGEVVHLTRRGKSVVGWIKPASWDRATAATRQTA